MPLDIRDAVPQNRARAPVPDLAGQPVGHFHELGRERLRLHRARLLTASATATTPAASATVRTVAVIAVALLAPTSRRERDLADSYEAGQHVAPFLLLLLVVLAAGFVELALLIVKIRRRRAEMRKIAEE